MKIPKNKPQFHVAFVIDHKFLLVVLMGILMILDSHQVGL